jgi:hypothetical protein
MALVAATRLRLNVGTDNMELLEAIALEGFERLTAAMKKRSVAGATAAERLRLCGCGYVDFALRWRHHFLVMFDLPSRGLPKHDTVGENAFQTLLGFIIESQKQGVLPEGDPHPLALMAWSMVHGIAKLAISGNLPYSSKQVIDFTQCASEAFVSGMGNLKQLGNWGGVSQKRQRKMNDIGLVCALGKFSPHIKHRRDELGLSRSKSRRRSMLKLQCMR